MQRNKYNVYQLSDSDVEYLNSLQDVKLFPEDLQAPTLNKKVEIIHRPETGGKCAFAKQTIYQGEVVCFNDGAKISKPIRYSWQIDENTHMIGPGVLDHSCEKPTCCIDSQSNSFVSLRDIQKGEYLTFNYLTTEYDMSSPFVCICGEKNCFHTIKGFKHLKPYEKKYITDNFRISSYIKKKYDEES